MEKRTKNLEDAKQIKITHDESLPTPKQVINIIVCYLLLIY